MRNAARTAAYARHLDQLATRTEEAWREAAALIETKRPDDYDQAVTLLRDLRALAGGRVTWPCSPDGSANFSPATSASPSLLERFDRAGLSP